MRADLKGFQGAVLRTPIDRCLAEAAESAGPTEERRITHDVMELLETTLA